MQKSLQFRLGLSIAIVIIALVYLFPTYTWYSKSPEERETLEKQKDPLVKKILNLGLDLKGGIYLKLEVDTSGMETTELKNDAVDQALEVIRNRVDMYGVSEPLITRQGINWIDVQLPGIKDPERAIDLVGKTALLEFKLVDDKIPVSSVLDEKGNVIPGKLPEGLEVVPGKDNAKFILKKQAELTGASLVDARVEIGEFNMPHVSIEFESEGAKKFAQVTGKNIEKNLAIVLDGMVQSAPVIRTKIPDGKAIIEGNFTMEEAKNLKIVLKAGALPAPIKILENRTVGPSLGHDSIKAGLISCIIGVLLTVAFMLVYYNLSGLIADFALILNLVLLMGALAALRATLTMPGIAGIILTLGMAVDANVLIYERIREELLAGKTVRVAIDAGYEKAMVTIIDSNLTTLIAALFLFQFGTGPIKGFAVTLFLGIIISMYTAIVITHLIFDLLYTGKTVKKLSI